MNAILTGDPLIRCYILIAQLVSKVAVHGASGLPTVVTKCWNDGQIYAIWLVLLSNLRRPLRLHIFLKRRSPQAPCDYDYTVHRFGLSVELRELNQY